MVSTAGKWDLVTDVVVVGSGAAALTAALSAAHVGADVMLIEKEAALGGTSGVSGGVMWVPNNRHLPAAGLEDTRADAIAYIRHIADGQELDPRLVEVFVDTAPQMLEFLEANSPLRTQPVTALHDYYEAIIDRVPGCKPFSRSVEPLPYPARDELGPWADLIATRSTLLSLGASTTLAEDMAAFGGISANLDELARREREGVRVKGAALVACLLRGLLDLGVDVRVSTPASELVVDDTRRVVGVKATPGGSHLTIGARCGVVLACGGFEWNRDMVLGYLGYDVKPVSPGGNTGDGHVMAMEAGALMGNMGSYWGEGAVFDPTITRPDGTLAPQMSTGLGSGSIIVNRSGRRFMRGGHSYNDFPKPFGHFDPELPGWPNRPPGWIIFGSTVKEKRPILTMRPGEPAPDWLPQGATIRDLAKRIGIDPEALERTVADFNAAAERGEDPEWGSRNPRPVVGPPFYALEQWPASLGTNGGCRLNEHGQVLGHRQSVIPGLYAAGNTSASVLGGAYPGGGTPIASGATFGYLAGRHAAAQPPQPLA